MNPDHSSNRIEQLYNLCKPYKIIHDTIHGNVELSKLAMMFVDTSTFQRLRYLKQLGLAHYVFPSANHTRFEHSIGTYHLAKLYLAQLKASSDVNEINEPLTQISQLVDYFKEIPNENSCNKYILLDQYICELIQIAALLHDLGHGPFSHMYDDIILQNNKEVLKACELNPEIKEYLHHEFRSTVLLKKIINDNPILKELIKQNEIEFICKLINPDKDVDKGYIFQIVSNTLNDLDVDKFDYLARDTFYTNTQYRFKPDRIVQSGKIIQNKICFPKQIDSEIINVFKLRHYMHRYIYQHKAIISIQHIFAKCFTHLQKESDLYSWITTMDLNHFIKLTDEDISVKIRRSDNEQIKQLWNNIESRKLNPLIKTFTMKPRNKSKFIINNKELFLEKFGRHVMKKEIVCYESIIGYVSGNKPNPLNSVYLFSTKNSNLIFPLNESDQTLLLPSTHQERIVLIFYNIDYEATNTKEIIEFLKENVQMNKKV